MEQQMGGMPPPPQQGKTENSLFKHKTPPKEPDFSEVRDDMNNLERRLRILEESLKNIRKSLQVAEQNMLSKNKTFSTEIKTLTSEIDETKKEISEIKEKVMMILRELESAAKIDEVKVLEKYINLWNPIKFVTAQEVERIVDEKLSNRKV